MTARPAVPTAPTNQDGSDGSVVVVGSANADLLARTAVHPAPGETVLGRDLAVLPGGKGANQAVAAARLGARVAFVGAVGDDEFAQAATSGLRDAGVDLDRLTVVEGSTGVAVVTVAADGENSIVVIPGANAAVDASLVRRHADLLAGAAVVVLQGEIPRDGVEAAAHLAGGRLVVNLAPVIEVDPAVLRRADPLVVNEHEAHAALRLLDRDGGTGPGVSGELPDDEVVGRLRALGVPSVVLTRGAQGALVAARGLGADGDVVSVPAPRVDAVDTTGAGDAFVGALAGELARGSGLVDAAHLAARVGAFAVRGSGAQPSYPWAGDELP
ncbi:ribokinase [Isoptericola sp. 4D.3]|uniref:Ribokinase n=1 Tax=Isoptericola peretonis TaxID=2918523 RepID=A0ABT0J191_9MICO|nr:ribokinase [Isoptericola sp. 4D.3]